MSQNSPNSIQEREDTVYFSHYEIPMASHGAGPKLTKYLVKFEPPCCARGPSLLYNRHSHDPPGFLSLVAQRLICSALCKCKHLPYPKSSITMSTTDTDSKEQRCCSTHALWRRHRLERERACAIEFRSWRRYCTKSTWAISPSHRR